MANLRLIFILLLLSACDKAGKTPKTSHLANNLQLKFTAGCAMELPYMRKISVPLSYADPNGEKIEIKFRLQIPTPLPDNKIPIIVIPGGPGGEYIVDPGDYPLYFRHRIAVYLSPRAVGCNLENKNVKTLPESFYSGITFAQDVIQIAKWLTNEQDYSGFVLYGQSYGTLVATIAASLIDADLDDKLRAVVLEGVVGHARKNELYLETAKLWQQMRDNTRGLFHQREHARMLNNGNLAVEKLRQKLPNAYDPIHKIIENFLGKGVTLRGGHWPFNLLLMMHKIDSEESLQTAVDILAKYYTSLTEGAPGGGEFFNKAACEEFLDWDFRGAGSPKYEFSTVKFARLEFQPTLLTVANDCTGKSKLKKFASSDWQIKAPVFYFNGKEDPYTPAWEAQEHYDGQTKSRLKEIYVIDNAGHSPLYSQLSACSGPIWDKILLGASAAEEVKICNEVTQALLPKRNVIDEVLYQNALEYLKQF